MMNKPAWRGVLVAGLFMSLTACGGTIITGTVLNTGVSVTGVGIAGQIAADEEDARRNAYMNACTKNRMQCWDEWYAARDRKQYSEPRNSRQ